MSRADEAEDLLKFCAGQKISLEGSRKGLERRTDVDTMRPTGISWVISVGTVVGGDPMVVAGGRATAVPAVILAGSSLGEPVATIGEQ
jgi:hypothetical protein